MKIAKLLKGLLLTTILCSTYVFGQDETVLSDFQQSSSLKAGIDYYDTWSYERLTHWIPANGDLNEYLMVSCRGNFNADWEYGVTAPDGSTAAKLTTGLTTWGGWTQAILDFTSNADSTTVSSVPLPTELTASLKSGEKVVALDVYFEDLDAEHPFDTIAGFRAANKLKQGIKIQIRMQNAEAYAAIQEGPAFLTKEAYVTKAGEWQTLYFTMDDTADFTPNEIYDAGDNIDRFMVILNYQYPSAVSSNYFVKNLRVVDNPANGTIISDLMSPSLLRAHIDYFDTWSYQKATDWLPANPEFFEHVMLSCRGGFSENWEYGQTAPDGSTAAKLTSDLTTWGGWTLGLIDFVKNADSANVISDTLAANVAVSLKKGETMLALDVYFEDLDADHPFDSIASFRSGAKNKNGIKFQIRLQNAEEYATLGNAAANGSYLTKEAYITEPDKWQTLFFYADDLAEIEANPLWNDSSKIDRILLGINYGYNAAITSNYWVKNLRIVDQSVIGDTEAPSVPANVMVTPGRTNAELVWDASTDNSGVSVYKIYDESWFAVQTSYTETTTLTGLTTETEYTYFLTAVDGFGNESAADTITFSTLAPDTEAPSVPADLTGTPGASSIALTWSESTDNDEVSGYIVYQGDEILDSVDVASYSLQGLESQTEYTFGVSAYDPAGNESAKATITVSTIKGAFDITIDGILDEDWSIFELRKIENLLEDWTEPESAADCSGEFRLAWSADGMYMFIQVYDDVRDIDAPEAYNRDHIEIDIDPENNKPESEFSSGQMQISFIPDAASSPTLWLNGETNEAIDISKLIYSFLEKNSSYIFEIFFPWNAIGLSTAPEIGDYIGFDVTIADDDGANRETVLAYFDSDDYDTWNNPSDWASLELVEGGAFELYVDPEAPGMVGNLAYELNCNDITLTWDAATDNVGIAEYRILDENLEVAATVDGNTTTYTFLDKEPGTYGFTVIARDLAGNASEINYDAVAEVTVTETDCPNAVDDIKPNSAFVYPNPFTNELYIKDAGQLNSVRIVDISGKEILLKEVDTDLVKINTANMNAGIYFVKLIEKTGKISIIKVVK